MKISIKLLLACCLLSHFQLWADTLEVDYSSFYSHVKKLDSPETDILRFAFGFQHISENRLCRIVNAKIHTQKQTIDLDVENNSRFTVPTDKILKMAKAKVILELDDQANQCDMSVQLETLPDYLKKQYTQEEVSLLLTQYQAFFEKMGGFLSFMMPSVEGLLFHFEPEVQVSEQNLGLVDSNGKVSLKLPWFKRQQGLYFTIAPLRITAIVKK